MLKNENLQVIVAVAIVIALLIGVYIAESAGYVAVVPSGSMCIPDDKNGWIHPFARTLMEGDILIIVPVNPKDLNTNYPNSDIIVYNTAVYGRIVHRIVAPTTVNGQIAFYTKGDGNGQDKWPTTPSVSEYDPWSPIQANQIVGKVVLRIPWIGHITLFLQSITAGNSGRIVIPIIVVIIALLVVVEIIGSIRNKKTPEAEKEEPQTIQPESTTIT
jgi:hypothetical protein